MHFQDGYTWGLEELYVGFDTETVALHEIGHLVGLKHSSVEGAIMLPEYPGVERRELNPDDLAAVEALYPAPGLLASSIVFQFRQHFGNEEDLLPGTFVGRAEEYRFDCPRVDRREQAFLHFLARHVSNDANLLIVNGQGLAGGVPRTSGEDAWSGHVVLIPDGVLNTVANTLRVESRNGSGGTDGDVDDFVLDNMVVVYPTIRWGCVVRS